MACWNVGLVVSVLTELATAELKAAYRTAA